MTLEKEWLQTEWQYWLNLQEELLPCAAASTRTWVNQCISHFQRLGCMQENLSLQWATWDHFYLRNFAMSSWRGTECSEGSICSESVGFVSLSSLDVFFFPGWFVWLFVWFGCLFGLFPSLRTSSLLHFHLFSHNLRIVDRPQTFWWPSEPRARTAWATKKFLVVVFFCLAFLGGAVFVVVCCLVGWLEAFVSQMLHVSSVKSFFADRLPEGQLIPCALGSAGN